MDITLNISQESINEIKSFYDTNDPNDINLVIENILDRYLSSEYFDPDFLEKENNNFYYDDCDLSVEYGDYYFLNDKDERVEIRVWIDGEYEVKEGDYDVELTDDEQEELNNILSDLDGTDPSDIGNIFESALNRNL